MFYVCSSRSIVTESKATLPPCEEIKSSTNHGSPIPSPSGKSKEEPLAEVKKEVPSEEIVKNPEVPFYNAPQSGGGESLNIPPPPLLSEEASKEETSSSSSLLTVLADVRHLYENQ